MFVDVSALRLVEVIPDSCELLSEAICTVVRAFAAVEVNPEIWTLESLAAFKAFNTVEVDVVN